MPVPVIVPLAVGALLLAGCAKAATEVRKSRPLATLEGSEWGPMKAGPSEQFVAFKANGEINGNAGCNQFFGDYSQDGTDLTIGTLASTRRACAIDVMDAEIAFLKNLQNARRAEGTHKALTLYDAEGDVLLELKRRDWD